MEHTDDNEMETFEGFSHTLGSENSPNQFLRTPRMGVEPDGSIGKVVAEIVPDGRGSATGS